MPTPVAVAVADLCRRAKAPASPGLVRDALSVLDDSDDAAVRRLADAAPPATPLGPFAICDIIRGTPAATAAERQQAGYYELVAVALQGTEAELPAPAPSSESVTHRPSASSAPAAKRPAKTKRQSLSDKIAPRRRGPDEHAPRPVPKQSLPGTAFLPKRNLPPPRGRFTRVDPSRSSYEALLKPDSRDALTAIVDQSATRFHVFRTLEAGYSGRAGTPLTVADVEGALTRHDLLASLQRKERERVLTALTGARGSISGAAKELDLKPKDVEGLVKGLKLRREVGEITERFVREALDPSNLTLRLSLLGRQRYLIELKIEKRFNDALIRDVTKLLDESAEAATTVPDLVALTAKKHAIVPDLLNRAVDRLGLTRRYTR